MQKNTISTKTTRELIFSLQTAVRLYICIHVDNFDCIATGNMNFMFMHVMKREDRNTHSDHHHLENDITTPEVSSGIKSLKLGKAPGPDGIRNEFIKNCETKLVHWLNEFLNVCYRHIRIPKQWHHANVISLLKPGKPETSPRSYGPISSLCTTYKLLEQILVTGI